MKHCDGCPLTTPLRACARVADRRPVVMPARKDPASDRSDESRDAKHQRAGLPPYRRMGCTLGTIDRFAYADLPDEVQLMWFKEL